MWRLTLLIVVVAIVLAGAVTIRQWREPLSRDAPFVGASAARGRLLIEQAGCGGCHQIPGIASADGLVGPPLDHMGRRIYIAGLLRNTPANMVRWLRDPQDIVPGNAMPDLELSEEQARHITAYLYTLE